MDEASEPVPTRTRTFLHPTPPLPSDANTRSVAFGYSLPAGGDRSNSIGNVSCLFSLRPGHDHRFMTASDVAETVSSTTTANMLLLPFLFIWAHAPMHFSTSHLRILITASVMVTLLSPLLTLSPNSLASAADAFDREDLRATRNAASAQKPVRLREGTLIPPTAGTIVLVGRRWVFVPASTASAPGDVAVNSDSLNATSNEIRFRPKPRPVRLGAAGAADATPDWNESATRSVDDPAVAAVGTDRPRAKGSMPQMLVGENLMLQRIVEAVRIDPSDDRWTVSGEVTEFFDENQLIIRTAQRANAKK